MRGKKTATVTNLYLYRYSFVTICVGSDSTPTVRIRVGLSLRREHPWPAAGRSVFRAIEQLALNSRHLSTKAGRLARHHPKRWVAALFTGKLQRFLLGSAFPRGRACFFGSGGSLGDPAALFLLRVWTLTITLVCKTN